MRVLVLTLGLLSVLAAAGLWAFWPRPGAGPRPGDPAPDFTLPDQHGRMRSLHEWRGQWVVLYFYPKDDTPGCTREACLFRDDIEGVRARGAEVVGVSLDRVESHRAFAEKYRLPFPLLADTHRNTAAAYGSLFALGPLAFARRHSFIIDPQGRVARVYRDVDPQEHAHEILADLEALRAAAARSD